jgi:hypothetical protein
MLARDSGTRGALPARVVAGNIAPAPSYSR